MKSRVSASVAISTVVILLGLTASALAGPPLIQATPFEIGPGEDVASRGLEPEGERKLRPEESHTGHAGDS